MEMTVSKGKQAVNPTTTKGFALTQAQRHNVATAIVQATDKRGAVATFRETILSIGKSIKGLIGKPLDADTAQDIADDCEAQYVAVGHTKDSVKSMKSAALKLARCAPVLAKIDREFADMDGLKKYCTALQKANFVVADADVTYAAAEKARKAAKADPNRVMQNAARSMLALKGKTPTAEQRAVLCLAFDVLGIDLGEHASQRNVKAAKAAIAKHFG